MFSNPAENLSVSPYRLTTSRLARDQELGEGWEESSKEGRVGNEPEYLSWRIGRWRELPLVSSKYLKDTVMKMMGMKVSLEKQVLLGWGPKQELGEMAGQGLLWSGLSTVLIEGICWWLQTGTIHLLHCGVPQSQRVDSANLQWIWTLKYLAYISKRIPIINAYKPGPAIFLDWSNTLQKILSFPPETRSPMEREQTENPKRQDTSPTPPHAPCIR